MPVLARLVLGAVIVATIVGVVFFELTGISITGGLLSLFALLGIIVSWIIVTIYDMLIRRRARGRSPAVPEEPTLHENGPAGTAAKPGLKGP